MAMPEYYLEFTLRSFIHFHFCPKYFFRTIKQILYLFQTFFVALNSTPLPPSLTKRRGKPACSPRFRESEAGRYSLLHNSFEHKFYKLYAINCSIKMTSLGKDVIFFRKRCHLFWLCNTLCRQVRHLVSRIRHRCQ